MLFWLHISIILMSLPLLLIALQTGGVNAVNSQPPQSTGLLQVLQQLNGVYKIGLNIFINMRNSSQDMLDLQFLDTPRIQIQLSENCSNDYRVFGRFTEKTLIVAYIQSPPLDAPVAALLPRLL